MKQMIAATGQYLDAVATQLLKWAPALVQAGVPSEEVVKLFLIF